MANASLMVKKALENNSPLPFKRIPYPMICCAENAIRSAWNALRLNQSGYGINLYKDDEGFVSYALVRILNFLCQKENRPYQEFIDFVEYFESVNISSGCKDYKGNKITQPDFALKPRNNPNPGLDAGYYAIFVEAKVIHETGQQTSEYFAEGVKRFLIGKYAWAMPHGLMLAYVRSGQDALQALNQFLNGWKRMPRFNTNQLAVFAKQPNRSPKVYVTVHERKWTYEKRPGAPGDIELRHLWLNAN